MHQKTGLLSLARVALISLLIVAGSGIGGACVGGEQASKIAYVAGNAEGTCDNIFVANPDGSDAKSVTNYAAEKNKRITILRLAWSPDGKKLAFILSEMMDSSVCIVDLANSQVTKVSKPKGMMETPSGVTWSPDGNRLAFAFGDMFKKDIYTVAVDGSNLTKITAIAGALANPVWSPDGKRIAVLVKPGQKTADGATNYLSPVLNVMNADGSGIKAVSPETGNTAHFAWSPDGAKLVFSHSPVESQQGNATVLGSPEIHIVNADGGNSKKLTAKAKAYDDEPAWSPDGTQIIFSSSQDGPAGVYVMAADGSGVKRLSANEAGQEHGAAAWSHDGKHIAYALKKSAWSWTLCTMKADGTEPKELAENVKNYAWLVGK